MDLVSLIIHVSAAAVFVGPQLLMFYAVTPASWIIEDEQLKRRVVSVIARRFGMLSGIALLTLLVTGLYQFYTVVPEPIQQNMMDYRFGVIFVTKMTAFTAVLILVLLHAMIYSRRIKRVSEAVEAGEATVGDLERARANSFAFSAVLLLVSFGVLWLGVALGHDPYAYVSR